MEKFTVLTGVAAPLNMINVDTDMIIPKNYLKTIKRTGLGKFAFAEMRYDEQGREKADFVLNKGPYRSAKILVAGQNFGCGSSREHAPWALVQYGFRVVVAPSFADIFFNNSTKNGLLPVVLPELVIDRLFSEVAAHPGYRLTVDLPRQKLVEADGREHDFDVAPFRKYCLVNGLDDIGLTLRHRDRIAAFEKERLTRQPWLVKTS